MSESSTVGRPAPSTLRFVPEEGPWGLSGTDLILTTLALGVPVIVALSEGDVSNRVSKLTQVIFGVAGWLPLLASARKPLVALALVLAVQNLQIVLVPLVDPVQFNSIPVALMVAVYSVGRRLPWRTAWLAGGLASVDVLVIGLMIRSTSQLSANMFALDLVLAATGAGVLIQSRHQRLVAMERRALDAEHSREEEARRRVAAERLRMARELHDVVAHNLTLVNAQSSVAEYLLHSNPVAAAAALRDISRHTRQALDELRVTVGLLRQDDDDPSGEELHPARGLADLSELVTAHRASGAAVTFAEEGPPRPLSALSDLSAYRIIQEALTNASKHAPAAWVHVQLRWSAGNLEIWIDNGAHPAGVNAQPGPGTGHGLLGMRERAVAAGGTLSSGPRTDGGFTVAAVIPVGTDDQEKEQDSE